MILDSATPAARGFVGDGLLCLDTVPERGVPTRAHSTTGRTAPPPPLLRRRFPRSSGQQGPHVPGAARRAEARRGGARHPAEAPAAPRSPRRGHGSCGSYLSGSPAPWAAILQPGGAWGAGAGEKGTAPSRDRLGRGAPERRALTLLQKSLDLGCDCQP